MTIDSSEAAAALSDIDAIARRVRQSRFYNFSSLLLLLWGALIFFGNVASWLWPPNAGYIWIAVNVVGIAGSFAVSTFDYKRMGGHSFDLRMVAAYVLFFAFGALWSIGLGHFTPRQLGVFWPTYFMMVYTIVGLWIGPAFVAIGLGITGLTLFGYAFIGNWFELWMAVVNGGGLLLGGFWMRRN
jgi:hypothetical protein